MEYEKITIGDKVYRLMPEDDYEADCMLALAAGAEPERAKTGYERVGYGGIYYSVAFDGSVREYNDEAGSRMHAAGDYVNDEQLYEDNERAIQIYRRMRQWQALNDVAVDIYNPEVYKYYIAYSTTSSWLHATVTADIVSSHEIYFSTIKKAKEALEVFRDDLIWLHTQYRRRLDEVRE